ncbi:hypothetical protein B566_EDAN008644 [Ephemera danica]|nr:hypothetical protein B566_EDAN008644 [Ephemera danica]
MHTLENIMVLIRCSLLLLLCFITLAVRASPTEQPYYEPEEELGLTRQDASHELYDHVTADEAYNNYEYGFQVNDPHTHNYQERQERREKGVVKGFYSLLDADGSLRLVTYTADEKGFRALVARQEPQINPKTGLSISATAHE